jgi:hypothetical protein
MANPMLVGFLFLTFIVGIILVVTTVNAQQKLPNNCVKNDMNIAMNFVLMLGIMLTVLPIMQLLCSNYCECDDTGNLWYKSLIGLFGIILAICGGIIWNGAKECTGADDVVNYGLGIMITGIVLPIFLSVYHFGLMKWDGGSSKSSSLSSGDGGSSKSSSSSSGDGDSSKSSAPLLDVS